MLKSRLCLPYRLLVFVCLYGGLTTGQLHGSALQTQLTQGGIYLSQVEPGTKVYYQGQQVEVSREGEFILGFGRDAELEQSYRLVDSTGVARELTLTLSPRDYRVQKINGVAKKYVHPAPSVMERIRTENAQVKKARLQTTLGLDDFFEGFSWPLSGPITGVFGSQRVFNGEPRRPHYGVDIAAPVGAPVKAPADGVVSLAEDDFYFSGGTLIIDHGYGVSSTFLHLSKVSVKSGQRVKRGDVIAEVGATGRVTGAHLDWRINWYDKRLDPQLLAGPQQK